MKMTFLCLANSRKEGGRCVAGIRLDNFSWFRPVSTEEHGELIPSQYTLDDGREVCILDIIRVDVSEHMPKPHQPENWILNDNYEWELIERVGEEKAYLFLHIFINADEYLFGDSSDSLKYTIIENHKLDASLCVIEPSDISWEIKKSRSGRRQTRAQFTYSRIEYDLVVTDPKWEERLGNLDYGTYIHNDLLFGNDERPGSDDTMLFTISLGLPFNGNCYKLVAGVIQLP